jgi:hypothetical protein
MHALERGRVCSDDVCEKAAKNGHFDCLVYAHTHGCKITTRAIQKAASRGHLNCLTYICEHIDPALIPENICSGASTADCLKYLHQKGFAFDRSTAINAALYGRLDSLVYACENGCEISDYICTYAAQGGHLDCLKYLLSLGKDLNEDCARSAMNGHMDCLVYIVEHHPDQKWSSKAFEYRRTKRKE